MMPPRPVARPVAPLLLLALAAAPVSAQDAPAAVAPGDQAAIPSRGRRRPARRRHSRARPDRRMLLLRLPAPGCPAERRGSGGADRRDMIA